MSLLISVQSVSTFLLVVYTHLKKGLSEDQEENCNTYSSDLATVLV